MNVGYYFTNSRIAGQDLRNIMDGNPGIGGTYYAMLLLVKLLSLKCDTGNEYYLFVEDERNLPDGINVIPTRNLLDLSRGIKEKKIDVLVVNKIGKDTLDKFFFNSISDCDVKVVIWAHCFIPYKELCSYSRNKKVSKVVAVGKEQLMCWCDHPIFNKATYIYNICNYPDSPVTPYRERKNVVVYVGSIVPLKGLHLLTAAWPTIKKAVPDAELYIIGSGNLYNKDAIMGKYGIADYFYEKQILKPVLDNKGQIDESVHFLGVLGKEKTDILNMSKVGVPNPSGLTETFGYTAIEMQLAGTQIATIKCPGYLDTVYDKAGILYNNTKELAQSVISLLQTAEYDNKDAISFIRHKFDSDNIIDSWISLFERVIGNVEEKNILESSVLYSTQLKMKNRRLKKILPFLPSIMLYETIASRLLYVCKKMIDLPTTLEKIYRRKIIKK